MYRKIPPGKTFSQVIEEAIDAAKCMIVLWSNESVKSHWVQNEAAEGARRRILVPALIDDVQMPFEFRRIQAADLTEWEAEADDSGFTVMLGAISEIVGPSAFKVKEAEAKRKAEPEPKPYAKATIESISPKPRKASNALKLGLLASVVVLIFVGIWWYYSVPQKKEIQIQKQRPLNVTDVKAGAQLFRTNFAMCHFHDRKDRKIGPGLIGLFNNAKLPASGRPTNDQTVRDTIMSGGNKMPPFKHFKEEEINSIIDYLNSL